MSQEPPDVPGVSDLSWLGGGGFADVYRGRQERFRRFVAVKVFRVAITDAVASEEFKNECGALGELSDEADSLRVYLGDVLADGRPYIVMELCETSLLQMIKRGPLRADLALEYADTVATTLIVARSKRLVHGDVTPQNVLLRRKTGVAVLADFGLAALYDYRGTVASGFNPVHAAPEVLRNAGQISYATDVYGLGSTLYTLLAGQPPFPTRPGEPDNQRSLRILTELAPRLTNVSPSVAGLVADMLAKDPAARPPIAVVADRLTAARHEVGSLSRALPKAPAAAVRPPPAATPVPPPPPADSAFAPPAEPADRVGPVYTAPPEQGTSLGLADPSAPTRPTGPQYAPPAAQPEPWFPPPQAPYPGGFAPPPSLGGTFDQTGRRAGSEFAPPPPAGDPAGPNAHPFDPGQTRYRSDAAIPDPTPPTRRSWLAPALGAGVALAAAAIAAAIYLTAPDSDATTTSPADAAPTAVAAPPADLTIDLADPTDNGDSVDLHWTGSAGLTYNVVVAQEGRPTQNTIVRQATDYHVSVDPNAKYCFRIQGADGRHAPVQSNVRAIRGAVCRFGA